MNQIKRSVGILLLIILALSCSQHQQTDSLRILFIGNSYTYYHSTPELLKALIQEKFPDKSVETKLISQGGMTLRRHWQEESTIETIKSGDWDYVVLQEQSKLGMAVTIDDQTYFGQTDEFFEYARKLDREIKKAGAKTVFFMTWSVRDQPNEQEILTHAYTSIAKELSATVVPVGLVWNELRTNENINLYASDGSHPSPIGSYVVSTTFFATLMAENPEGLSGTITGNRLTRSGEPSMDKELLLELGDEEAAMIQEVSWSVVDPILKAGGYPTVYNKPEPSYQIPVLEKGEAIDLKNITGKWFGTSTYGFNYHGQMMEIKNVDGKPQVSLSFYSPHVADQIEVEHAEIIDDQLILTVFDSLRSRSAIVRAIVSNGAMKGILASTDNAIYNHLSFTRESVHDEMDLHKLGLLMQSFEANSRKNGYVKAAIEHYEEYSKMIGESYTPEEVYLNAVGYNFLRDNKVNDALNSFELAITYYPLSVNAYDSYAEALIVAGRKEEALEVYAEAYELAKRTGYENLAYIEENLNKLKNNLPAELEGEGVPPPPPPPAQ